MSDTVSLSDLLDKYPELLELGDLKDGGRSLKAIWTNSKFNVYEKAILNFFGSHCNYVAEIFIEEKIYYYLSIIAQECGMSVDKARKVLKKLAEDGYIKIIHRKKTPTQNDSNIYCLTIKLFLEYGKVIVDNKTAKRERGVLANSKEVLANSKEGPCQQQGNLPLPLPLLISSSKKTQPSSRMDWNPELWKLIEEQTVWASTKLRGKNRETVLEQNTREKWYNEAQRIMKHLECDVHELKEIFLFIQKHKTTKFSWSDNAISVMRLMNKNEDLEYKIDKIVRQMTSAKSSDKNSNHLTAEETKVKMDKLNKPLTDEERKEAAKAREIAKNQFGFK